MPVGTSAWVPLGFLTLSATASSVTFSNIPATMGDLVIIADGSAVSSSFRYYLTLNNDVGTTTYWESNLAWNGNSTQNNTNPGKIEGSMSGSTLLTGIRSNLVATVFDYAATTKQKTVMMRSGSYTAGSGGMELVAGRWANTAAVTTVKIATETAAGNWFVAGTNVALYGVAA
jgi:hypothetical protein